jgi:hypothetical protein
MENLTTNQRRAFAGFLRGHTFLIRELSAHRNLLKFCEQKKIYPQNWEQSLTEMRKLPAYAKVAEELDTIASQLEKSADEIDVNELLSKFPKETPEN